MTQMFGSKYLECFRCSPKDGDTFLFEAEFFGRSSVCIVVRGEVGLFSSRVLRCVWGVSTVQQKVTSNLYSLAFYNNLTKVFVLNVLAIFRL